MSCCPKLSASVNDWANSGGRESPVGQFKALPKSAIDELLQPKFAHLARTQALSNNALQTLSCLCEPSPASPAQTLFRSLHAIKEVWVLFGLWDARINARGYSSAGSLAVEAICSVHCCGALLRTKSRGSLFCTVISCN